MENNEIINTVPLVRDVIPMSRLSEVQESKDSQLLNEKSTGRQHTSSTPEINPSLRTPLKLASLNNNKLNQFRERRESTKEYQNKVLKLNGKKTWKKRDCKLSSSSRGESEVGPRVLIVEDNQFNVFPIQSVLTKNRIEYDLAKNGLMAVDKYTEAMKDS